LYTSQELTEEQQAQARKNIGATTADATLSVEGEAADARAAGDAIRGVARFFKKETPVNRFNKDDPGNVYGAYINQNNGAEVAYNHYCASHYIPVQNGKTYTTIVQPGLYGATDAAKICGYNADKEFVAVTIGTLETIDSKNAYCTFTISNASIVYVRVTVVENDIASFMLVEGDSYPEEYQPYFEDRYILDGVEIPGGGENIEHFTADSIMNLYNPEDPDIVQGQAIDRFGAFTENASFNVSGFIPIEYGKKYTFPVFNNYWGDTTVTWIPYFDKDKNYRSLFTGVLDTEKRTLTIENTASSAKYIRVNVLSYENRNNIRTVYQNPNCFMVVDSDTFPAEYVPFGTVYRMAENNKPDRESELTYNPLCGKRIVFTGDSIGDGSSAGDGLSGWAGRIGRKNNMLWMNKSVSGATIAKGTNAYLFITETDFGDKPDYIIIEGGTNDADIIGDARTEAPALFGTYNLTDYTSEFDKTTFCGAVESLFKRVTTDYAGAKIGFIIAQKMGVLGSINTDYTVEHNNRRKYFETIIELCKKWGIPYLNLWDGCYLNPMNPAHFTSGESRFYTDGQHLTTAGYEYITPMIETWIKTL
jgi:lysophospholipase L1-like esterase